MVGVDDVERVLVGKRPDVRHFHLKSIDARIERCIHCIDPRAKSLKLCIVLSSERIDNSHDHVNLDGEFAAHCLQCVVHGSGHLCLDIDQILLVHGGEFIQSADARLSLCRYRIVEGGGQFSLLIQKRRLPLLLEIGEPLLILVFQRFDGIIESHGQFSLLLQKRQFPLLPDGSELCSVSRRAAMES